jgi:hypothetical protein
MLIVPIRPDLITDVEQLMRLGDRYVVVRGASDYWLYRLPGPPYVIDPSLSTTWSRSPRHPGSGGAPGGATGADCCSSSSSPGGGAMDSRSRQRAVQGS